MLKDQYVSGTERNKKLFVYGSLMEGMFNYKKYLEGKVISRKNAKTKGELYHLKNKGYPAMIEGNNYVYGELIEIIDFDNVIKDLDMLEGYYGEGNRNSEYIRKVVVVENVEDNKIEYAYAYMYNLNNDVDFYKNTIYIEQGSWKNFIKEMQN
ncbi:gamma-glutamylcyclotransferase [Caloramator sp. mosi_1]|uniref:gamma-glutamylcyclotransferase family protein n=1 Tax=Caloramator sp. mosi_1 TaxID=3023090 RepID=UPI00236012D8|nr:gamma-glutamylcyclotransferase family protein [Caloramator sp. mosi_1]WDC85319.1 gamma-glutamylcyclotransferase [Caloramator sp. mosi_1]